MEFSQDQLAVISADSTLFLTGPAGTGKTTALQERVLSLLNAGEPAYTILILVADPTQRENYLAIVQNSGLAYADLKIQHYGQLAREMVTLFWPLVATNAGFASGFKPPTFLGYDLAQLLMWRTVEPQLEAGVFNDLRRRPQQIVSQLLDTLNRAALNNLDIMGATARQIQALLGEEDQVRNLEKAKEVAEAFRQQCFENNLLDLSLTIDTFNRHVLAHAEFSRYFSERYRHLIVDNVEEQTPAGQHFILQLMNATESTAIAYDTGGGYRRFLAADPTMANRFAEQSRQVFHFVKSFTTPAPLEALRSTVHALLNNKPVDDEIRVSAEPAIIDVVKTRYRREMLKNLGQLLANLIYEEGVAPSEIAIVTPYLDSALRYILTKEMKRNAIPMNLVRRRASPREEPRVRAWLTWVALAHADWNVIPTEYDVAEALALSIFDLDAARAALLAAVVYPPTRASLVPADEIPEALAERIGSKPIEVYEKLRVWLAENGDTVTLDHFIYNLFTELLATPDFQPEPDIAGAGVCNWLVNTAVRLVDSAESLNLATNADIGSAFLTSINQGLVTSEPPEMGDPPDPNGVIISTLYGYLLRGQPVKYQVWLETGASGWWDIPRQPLSNAFVLAESWDPEQHWTIIEEIEIRNELLSHIISGLTARCSKGVILATSDLDRRGQRQDGPLWRAVETAGLVETQPSE